MVVSDAAKLLAVMAAFFLFDSALLLYANEAVLSRAGRRWRAQLGMEQVTISGRAVFFPNLLLVHRPLYRCAWQAAGSGAPGDDLDALSRRLRTLAPLVYGSAIAQFVALPITLFFALTTWNLIISAALVYGLILLSIGRVVVEHDHFGLPRKQLASLALECLLCPPIAINLVRRLSLAHRCSDDLSVLAAALLDKDDYEALAQRMANALDEQPQAPDADTDTDTDRL